MGLCVEGLFRGCEEGFDLGFIGDVGLHGDCAWLGGGGGGGGVDVVDERFSVRLGRRGGVVDDEFGA